MDNSGPLIKLSFLSLFNSKDLHKMYGIKQMKNSEHWFLVVFSIEKSVHDKSLNIFLNTNTIIFPSKNNNFLPLKYYLSFFNRSDVIFLI